jgi:fatty acid desaturase
MPSFVRAAASFSELVSLVGDGGGLGVRGGLTGMVCTTVASAAVAVVSSIGHAVGHGGTSSDAIGGVGCFEWVVAALGGTSAGGCGGGGGGGDPVDSEELERVSVS